MSLKNQDKLYKKIDMNIPHIYFNEINTVKYNKGLCCLAIFRHSVQTKSSDNQPNTKKGFEHSVGAKARIVRLIRSKAVCAVHTKTSYKDTINPRATTLLLSAMYKTVHKKTKLLSKHKISDNAVSTKKA